MTSFEIGPMCNDKYGVQNTMFSRKKPPESNHLPGFRYADLQHLEIIGQGSFSAVFTARLGVEDDQSDTVVVKKLLGGCDEKEFMKEA